MSLIQILEGVKNNFFPSKELKPLIEKTKEERLALCLNCSLNTTPGLIEDLSKCDGCGCFLKLKTACLSCNCGAEIHNMRNPNDQREVKWEAVTTEEQEREIKELTKD